MHRLIEDLVEQMSHKVVRLASVAQCSNTHVVIDLDVIIDDVVV